MGQEPTTVCSHCAARVQDTRQATCPHCLEPLSVKRFRSEALIEDYRQDRAAHGAPVPDQGGASRPGLALAFAFASGIMVLAAIGISFSGFIAGSWADGMRSVGQAIVPLAIGLGLAAVAREYSGVSS